MYEFLAQYWSDLSSLFNNSQQRLFWGYLLCAFIIGTLFVKIKQAEGGLNSIKKGLGIGHWLSASARADYQLIIINKAIYLLCNPLLLGKLTVATLIFELMHQIFNQRSLESSVPTWLIVSSFTFFVFILDDFARFYTHKLMHEIPLFWEFHKTHHSATHLTPLTVLRTHPVEGLIFAIRGALVQGISIGCFVFFFNDKVDLFTVLNVNIFLFIFNACGANLRHSHVSISYFPWLENILISPAQHHIHHSTAPRHFNKNYGAILAIWDKLFKTLHHSETHAQIQYGINRQQLSKEQTLRYLYIRAFINSAKIIRKYLSNIKAFNERQKQRCK